MLSSIWNLLVTEDELLTKIVTAPTVIVEAWLLFELAISIFKLSYTLKNKIFYITLMSLNSLFTEFVIPSPYNIFINYIIMFILIKITFNVSYIKSLLIGITPTAIFALTGTLLLKPFLLTFNITYNKVEGTILYRSLYLTIIYSFNSFINLVIKTFNSKTFSIQTLNTISNKKIILLNIITGLFTLCIQLIITIFYTYVLPNYISFSLFISLLIYFFISFFSLTKTMKLYYTTIELKNAENYNNTLSILYDNVKAFKHDFDNMVFPIGGFININDIYGLKKYYDSLEKDCQKNNNIALLNPKLINNPGIYNLLTTKYQKAQIENVEVQLDFFFDLSKLHMPIYDFSRILGIFLDNAIDASSTSNEKLIKILFRDSQKSRVQIVQIENSYTNKKINTDNIFEKGITEKENHLGIGLWEVKQILKRNNNVNLITENNDLYFKQCLEIYY